MAVAVWFWFVRLLVFCRILGRNNIVDDVIKATPQPLLYYVVVCFFVCFLYLEECAVVFSPPPFVI